MNIACTPASEREPASESQGQGWLWASVRADCEPPTTARLPAPTAGQAARPTQHGQAGSKHGGGHLWLTGPLAVGASVLKQCFGVKPSCGDSLPPLTPIQTSHRMHRSSPRPPACTGANNTGTGTNCGTGLLALATPSAPQITDTADAMRIMIHVKNDSFHCLPDRPPRVCAAPHIPP